MSAINEVPMSVDELDLCIAGLRRLQLIAGTNEERIVDLKAKLVEFAEMQREGTRR